MTPTPTQQPSKLALILQGLMSLAATLIGVFVKNPAHHDAAVTTLDTLNTVAVPIAQQLAQEAPGDPAALNAAHSAPTPELETGTPADPGHTEA